MSSCVPRGFQVRTLCPLALMFLFGVDFARGPLTRKDVNRALMFFIGVDFVV